jgi:hypothetical protein
MKKISISLVILGFFLFGASPCLNAQVNDEPSEESSDENTPSKVAYKLSDGIKFNFNEGAYQFGLGGMIQPFVGLNRDTAGNNKYTFSSRRTFFNFYGKALKEKVSFFIQTDFNLASPLMDAWISYTPVSYLKFTVGQQINFANNREMTLMEGQLQFIERSLLSTQFSKTGREFGLFVEAPLKIGKMMLIPMAAITSGDGRNSFGLSPTDFDLGGLKYAGRLDFYPLGKFSPSNDGLIADLAFEEEPKLVVGAAGSYNKGASEAVGEGHGNFLIYDSQGENLLPDYRKLHYDLLFKFKGFSVLGEYSIATGKVAQGSYKDVTALSVLKPTEISQYLALGNGFNTQIGYVFRKSLGIDVRYALVNAEFEENKNSLVEQKSELALGLTKYVNKNNLKINTSISQFNTSTNSSFLASFWVQIMF